MAATSRNRAGSVADWAARLTRMTPSSSGWCRESNTVGELAQLVEEQHATVV